MKTLDAIVDDLIRSVQGSVNAADSKFEDSYIEYLVPQLRASVILDVYNGTRFNKSNKLLPGELYMEVELEKVFADQVEENEYSTFTLESPPVELDENANGLVFVGDRNSTNSFAQVRSHEYLVMLNKAGLMADNAHYYLYEWPGTLKVYGPRAKSLKRAFVRYIPANPLDISTFDADTQPYPFPESWMGLLRDKARAFLTQQEQTIPDIVRDENNQRRTK